MSFAFYGLLIARIAGVAFLVGSCSGGWGSEDSRVGQQDEWQALPPVGPRAGTHSTMQESPAISSTPGARTLPVFPGAEGFGSTTTAGRGGRIIKVRNLNDAGPESLREALATTGPRIVVFEVGGTIRLARSLKIREPFVTLAGQTAPSPGITLRGAGIVVQTHDVLIQHIRIRVGDDPAGPAPRTRDAVQIVGPSAHNVFIDHVSASWSIDELVGTGAGVRNVTISNSVLSEALHASHHPDGPHSKGVLIGDNSHAVSLIGNLFAHNFDRNPALKGDVSALVVNNLFYNWGNGAATQLWQDRDRTRAPTRATLAANAYIHGPDTPRGASLVKIRSSLEPGTQIYLADQLTSGPQHDGKLVELTGEFSYNPKAASPPVWAAITIRPAATLEEWTSLNAGARPSDRDDVDLRIVRDLRQRAGRIIDSQRDVGGWPDHPGSSRALVLPEEPHRDDDGDGYTNLEEWLHRYSEEVEGRSSR